MNKGMGGCGRGGKRAVWLAPLMGVLLFSAAAGQREHRVVLLPQLRNGETLAYESHARVDKHVQTKSNVSTMLKPGEARRDLSSIVRLSVQEARLVDNRMLMAGETSVEPSDAPAPAAGTPAPKIPRIDFTIGGDGGVTRAEGLDDLDAEQLMAWQFWVAQFAFGWTLPAGGVRPGEKWKSEEVEKTPTPIANLVWEREINYVQNDKCPMAAGAGQQCAVFLISSTLRQKSNPKDATPEDFKIRQLKTSGTVRGTNETVAYISLQTGLLVRATEDVQQFMSVTIAKADDSNQIHYDVQVTSHFETALLPSGGSATQ